MPNTYTLIASNTLSTTTASVTFSSIASTYTDLLVKVSARTDNTDTPIYIYFNSDTTNANYSVRRLLGTGSAASSASFSAPYVIYADVSTYTASTFGNAEVYIPNYLVSSNKSMSIDSVNENNATGAEAVLTAGLWSNTAAITSIKFQPLTGNFATYSTFYLYGIKNS